METTNTTRFGIVLMVGFCILAPLSESFVKLLGTSLPLLQIVLARFATPIVLVRTRLWTDRRKIWMTGNRIWLIALRAFLHLVAIGCFFLSLRYLPLADALAIAYVMPFLIISVGWFTSEPATKLQAIMCLFGFLGALLVVQPSFANVGWPALLPLVVAFVFTGFIFLTRHLTKHIDPIDLQALNGLIATAILVPVLALGMFLGWADVALVPVTQLQLYYLLGVGVLGTIAHLFITWAVKYAQPSTLAPVQYLEIPFGALFGWWFFQEFPNGLAAIGICIVIAAGLMVLATSPKSKAQT